MRAQEINERVIAGEAWASVFEKLWQYGPYAFGFLSWIVGTYFASGVAYLSDKGWGASALVGVGVACVVSLAVTGSMAGYRYFRPLPPQIPVGAVSPFGTVETVLNAKQVEAIENRFAALDDKVGKLDATVSSVNHVHAEFICKTANELKEVEAKQKTLEDQQKVDRRRPDELFNMLHDKMRAGRAEAIIKECDAIVTSMGNRLYAAKPEDYPSETKWLADYEVWKRALDRIDWIVPEWDKSQKQFLNIRQSELENGVSPPVHIHSGSTVVPYRTVHLAMQSYANRRNDIIRYFEFKATP